MENEIFCTTNRSDALREVKKLSESMRIHKKIYLAYNEYYEKYFVTDDDSELSESIHKRWTDSGCDSKPEDESADYKIWQYAPAEYKERLPFSYKDAKRSLIRSKEPLIRRKIEIEVIYSVEFYIGF